MEIIELNNVYLNNAATVVGNTENKGPLSKYFDLCEEDAYFGEDSWELAETEMCRRAINLLMAKTKKSDKEIDLMIGGDLLNQCTATAFAANTYPIPFLGLYGACSTIVESMIISSVFIDSGKVNNAIALASSHFCSSERQFRFPLEYGSQRTPTAQNTVTGAGAYLLENQKSDLKITRAMVGKVIDNGVTDANNMGAAMATAAVDTLLRYFNESKENPADYDIISTGDLGREGYEIACELLKRCGLDLCGKFTDCGMLIYDMENQDVGSGASGCGCSACVCGSLYLHKFRAGEIKKLLLVGTGALLSPKTVLQKQPIPSIAHLVKIEKV